MIKYLFFFLALNSYSQNKIEESLLSIDFEIPKNSKVSINKIESSNIVTLSVFNKDNQFKYVLTVVEKENIDLLGLDSFKSSSYKNSYLEKCKCFIEEEEVINLNHRYFYRYYSKNRTNNLDSYVYNFVNKGRIYAFIFITNPNNFKLFKSEFNSILNTIK